MTAPLVYAKREALEQARELLPAATVLENVVERAIDRGRLRHAPPECVELRGGEAAVRLFDVDVVAIVRSGRGRIDPSRRAWTVVRLEPCP